MELNLYKFTFLLLSLFLVACSESEDKRPVFYSTLAFDDKAPEVGNFVKVLSPEDNAINVSWHAEEGYASKVYLSKTEHLVAYIDNFGYEEDIDYVTVYEAGKGVDVNINCQTDESYTVFECVDFGEQFGLTEKLMNQVLLNANSQMLFLIVHHYHEESGAASTASYGLIFSDN